MDIFDLLSKTRDKKPDESIKVDNPYITSGEADDFDIGGIPDGDFSGNMDTSFDDPGVADDGIGMDSMSFDDPQGMDGDGEIAIENPLDDVEDAEISLVANLRENFATLYESSKDIYERFISKNYDTSDFGAEFKEIQSQFKDDLDSMYSYIKNKYDKESTTTRIIQFSRYKGRLNTLIDTTNELLAKLDKKNTD
jgi:hypothetical protein